MQINRGNITFILTQTPENHLNWKPIPLLLKFFSLSCTIIKLTQCMNVVRCCLMWQLLPSHTYYHKYFITNHSNSVHIIIIQILAPPLTIVQNWYMPHENNQWHLVGIPAPIMMYYRLPEPCEIAYLGACVAVTQLMLSVMYVSCEISTEVFIVICRGFSS